MPNRTTWMALAIGGGALAIAAGYWFEPWKIVVDARVSDASPVDAGAAGRPLREGSFRSLEHETTGRAVLLELADGARVLRLEDLATSNGPELVVMLSATPAAELSWAAFDDGDFVVLAPLKGNLGSQNYPIPADVDPSRFRSAVVWCRRFSVGFGVAPLE